MNLSLSRSFCLRSAMLACLGFFVGGISTIALSSSVRCFFGSCPQSQLQGMVDYCRDGGRCASYCGQGNSFTVSGSFIPSTIDPEFGNCIVDCNCNTGGSGGEWPSDGQWECSCSNTLGYGHTGYGTTRADAEIACHGEQNTYPYIGRCYNRGR